MRLTRAATLAAHIILALAFLLPHAPAASRGPSERPSAIRGGGFGGGTGGRRGPSEMLPGPPPSPEPLLTTDQLRSRLLSLLDDPTVVHVSTSGVAKILHRDRDKAAWDLLLAGIRTAEPGIPAPGEPEIILRVSCMDPSGKWSFHSVGLERGMLGIEDPRRGGMIPTLRVGPDFLQGMEQILKATGSELPKERTESSYAEPSFDHGELRYRELLQAAPVGREQALAIAKRFAADFGLPLGDRPQALFFPDENLGTAGRWLIPNRRFAEISVDAREGCVMHAENGSASFANVYTGTRVALTKQQAIDKATRVTTAMGLSGASLSAPSATLQESPSGLGSRWRVKWHRVLDGIPYRAVAADVVFGVASGALLHANRDFTPSPLPSTTPAFDASRAASLALYMAPEILRSGDVTLRADPTLEIVHPTHALDPPERRRYASENVYEYRLAWIVLVTTGVRHAEIWLDAANASVLGGSVSGPPLDDPAGTSARTGGARGAGGRRRLAPAPADTPPKARAMPAIFPLTALAALVLLILIIAVVVVHERRAARRPPAPE